jgi:uncharacterized protein (TIGR02271 family)
MNIRVPNANLSFKETKHIDVELTHEELVLERRPLAEPRMTDEEPVESRTEIKIRLKREEFVLVLC